MLDKLTLESFAPHVGEEFRLPLDAERALVLHLLQIDVWSHPTSERRARAPFTLVFRGPAAAAFPQGIYLLQHPVLGSLELFLVPIGPDAQGMCYEANFN